MALPTLSWLDYELDAELDGVQPIKSALTLENDTDPFAILDGNRRHQAWAGWFAQLFFDHYPNAGAGGTYHLRRIHYRLASLSSETPIPMVGSVAQNYAISDTWVVPAQGRKKRGQKAGDTFPNVYDNDDACWQKLCRASKWARHLGFIDAELIIDNRSPAADPCGFGDLPAGTPKACVDTGWRDYSHSWAGDDEIPSQDEIFWEYVLQERLRLSDPPLMPTLSLAGTSEWRHSRSHHLEIWVEKSTMNDILLPICQRHGIVLQSLVGESSLTRTGDLVRRIRSNGGLPCRVFYLSDFDPGGNSMPAAASRRVEHLVRSEAPELDVQVTHLLLTREQVEEYSLPTIPIKGSEVRGDKFRERQDTDGAVELDALEALHPGVLEQLVSGAIAPYIEADIDHQAALEELADELRSDLEDVNDEVADRHRDALAAHQQAIEEINARTQERYRQLREDHIRELGEVLNAARPAYQDALDDLEGSAPYLDDIDLPEAAVIDEGDPLLSTRRDYLEQLDRYRQHKGVIK